MTRIDCECCGSVGQLKFLNFNQLPLSGVFRSMPGEAEQRIDLTFDLCQQCGLVRQIADSGPREYAAVTRSTTLQFPTYVHDLLETLKQSGVGPDDLVLEIGCNDGLFLSALRDAGFKNLLGVEPSQVLAAVARTRGHTVVCDYFGLDLVALLLQQHGAAKALICRHTLEHVPKPDQFARAIAQCLVDQDGLALVEVPDGAAIPELLNVYEFWDEHLFYFSANNLRRLLGRNGLQVVDLALQPHLATRNLLVWCKKAAPQTWLDVEDAGDAACVALWQRLLPRWSVFKAHFSSAVQQAPKPIYAIGASHSQTNLINYAGLGPHIDFFIDDDSAKVGRLPPVAGSHATILSTQQFEMSAKTGTLLQTGFGYDAWTRRLCGSAAVNGMTVLAPQDFVDGSMGILRSPTDVG